MIIAVDATGGEYAPHEIVKGAIKAAQDYEVGIALVGKKDILYVQAGRHLKKSGITIVNASEVIEDKESPVEAVNSKPDSSIVVGMNLVKSGMASAFVSAGNTGAVLYAAFTTLGMIEGVERPAICSIIGINVAHPFILLDSGANADCRPKHLVQFAQLGSIYAREVLKVDPPRVSLLNNGEEEGKGNKLAKASHQLLKKIDLNFTGNIECQNLSKGMADVVVTDGFTGNIVLKTLESMGDAFLKIRNVGQVFSNAASIKARHELFDVGITSLVKRMDYREYGGASLLGLDGDVVIAHGRSQSKAIRNAIGSAKRSVESGVRQLIKEQNFG